MNRIPDLLHELEMLEKLHLEIGILSDGDTDLTMIASVHEFGVDIGVTEKMRAFLHSIGIHLKPETTVIKIPERSFMRGGFDNKLHDIDKTIQHLLGQVFDGKLDAVTFYESIGGQVVSYLQEYLTALSSPPNHPVTVERKGSSQPLIDTGRLRDGITFKVVGK